MERVTISDRAIETIDELRDRFGELMFHQSGGCAMDHRLCAFEKGDFKVGGGDVWLDKFYGCDFFMSKDQFEYWKHNISPWMSPKAEVPAFHWKSQWAYVSSSVPASSPWKNWKI